jgi:hypothetical protein
MKIFAGVLRVDLCGDYKEQQSFGGTAATKSILKKETTSL